jgi:TPP-dependent pyruvate/acetoin dehydrogenase alpha subunit
VRQPEGRKLHELAAAIGLSTGHGDGNDVLAVKRATRDAVAAIRAGRGPQFLEFATYRWREHCGPNYDNDIGYRQEAEFRRWQERDPVRLFAERLRAARLLSEGALADIDARVQAEVAAAFDFAERSPFPEPSEFGRFVYKEAP